VIFFSLIGAAVLLLLGTLRWRYGLFGVLLLVIYEGALRKWVFPSLQQEIYFAKNLLLVGSYFGFFGGRIAQNKRLTEHHAANMVIALLAAVCTLEILNPLLPSPLVGVFGWLGYIFYIPIMYMVPHVFSDAKAIKKFAKVGLGAAIVPLLLGPIQFNSSPDSLVNRYAWDDASIATMGSLDITRVTGTFSYITGYTTFLMLAAFLVLGLLVYTGTRYRWLIIALLGLIIANMYMTGSRAPFLLIAITSPIMFLMVMRSKKDRDVRLVIFSILVIPILVLLTNSIFPSAVKAFRTRASEADDAQSRIVETFTKPVIALSEAGAAGWGIGSTHQAAHFLIPNGAEYEVPPSFEMEPERIAVEIGPFGFVLVMLTRILVAVELWRGFRLARGSASQPFLAVGLCFVLVHLAGNVVFNTTAAVLFWFVAGFAFIPRYLHARSFGMLTGGPVVGHLK
jgi:hypothetical protein